MAMHMVGGTMMTEMSFKEWQGQHQSEIADQIRERRMAIARNSGKSTMVGTLKRCPFCGGNAELLYLVDNDKPYVRCAESRDRCKVNPSTAVCKTVEEAIKIWNTRYNG